MSAIVTSCSPQRSNLSISSTTVDYATKGVQCLSVLVVLYRYLSPTFCTIGSATGSQLGSRTKSQESLASLRPPSQAKSPTDQPATAAGGHVTTADREASPAAAAADLPREPTPVPQTRYECCYNCQALRVIE